MVMHTHEVFNQYDELTGYNLFATDQALVAAVTAADASWALPALEAYGGEIGSAESFHEAELANRHLPELEVYDRRGRRIDHVEFHPAWHSLMTKLRGAGWIALPFRDQRPGRWIADIAGFYLHCQVESGTSCPSTMTWAAIPLLQREKGLWQAIGDKLYSDDHDARDLPMHDKRSICIGMGMTEKQGGSDVRANTTTARPVGAGGRGAEYLIRGHKWFFSAPMCDAHLVVAQFDDAGPSCFFVPRWRPDDSRNPVRIQRLKNKLGNCSNSSSEVEFDDALGMLIGEPGRGIPTIIEMANHTRLACVMSSAAFIRQALVQSLAYTRQRKAFGKVLAEQPLMRAVLADLALESEAALVLTMRLAAAFERDDDPRERVWKRIVTPAAKFWVCKRAVELVGEAMETFGGNGYVEPGVMARLFREAPVNSIWEGSGNVMCLDLIRAFARDPDAMFDLLADLEQAAADDAVLRSEIDSLRGMLKLPPDQLEAVARLLAQRLVLVVQAALLRRSAPAPVADAFIASRIGAAGWGRVVGGCDLHAVDIAALLARAFPQ
ncbi:acyl-CoA dehydrogenase family protein [Piscinibacter sakaiensis]|uniref:acyl-CoA dehydrogenase family protein n=1 Tax=Piscinibacter sakaiensis TaxID=1547922 RepID=UPI003AAF0495